MGSIIMKQLVDNTPLKKRLVNTVKIGGIRSKEEVEKWLNEVDQERSGGFPNLKCLLVRSVELRNTMLSRSGSIRCQRQQSARDAKQSSV
jgi:hypothetical protein